MFEIEPSWKMALEKELEKPYILKLSAFIEREYRSEGAIYPPKELIFNAFWKTPFSGVKVVIVGQDPYHGAGQAHGLAFSVPKDIPKPPSLKNIFKELKEEMGKEEPSHGCLGGWAAQGVLLLNATLTVREKDPLSHHGKGWEQLTDACISRLVEEKKHLVFLLWGKSAQEKCRFIEGNPNHLFLKAAHPSPFSAYQGFFGCSHFLKANAYLEKNRKTPISW